MIPSGVEVYVASTLVDFRKGSLSLMALVRDGGVYRQEAIYARDKVELSRSLMAQWRLSMGAAVGRALE